MGVGPLDSAISVFGKINGLYESYNNSMQIATQATTSKWSHSASAGSGSGQEHSGQEQLVPGTVVSVDRNIYPCIFCILYKSQAAEIYA
jgi:hypothetical protein